ncbi:MAG: hypothetical protein AB1815_08020 [Bacillota bacterium]
MTRKQFPGETDSYSEKLKHLKDGLDRANNLRIQAETRLEELSRQEKEIIEQIRALGVEPEHLDEEIERLEKEIKALFLEIEEIIPWELIEQGRGDR